MSERIKRSQTINEHLNNRLNSHLPFSGSPASLGAILGGQKAGETKNCASKCGVVRKPFFNSKLLRHIVNFTIEESFQLATISLSFSLPFILLLGRL